MATVQAATPLPMVVKFLGQGVQPGAGLVMVPAAEVKPLGQAPKPGPCPPGRWGLSTWRPPPRRWSCRRGRGRSRAPGQSCCRRPRWSRWGNEAPQVALRPMPAGQIGTHVDPKRVNPAAQAVQAVASGPVHLEQPAEQAVHAPPASIQPLAHAWQADAPPDVHRAQWASLQFLQ